MPTPLSVIILTFNEESTIAEAIESVQWADEVLVVDSFSKDATLQIAGNYPVRIVQHGFENYSLQRNWAITQASHDLILMLDADERITPALRDELISMLKGTPALPAYRIKRNNYFMGKLIRYSGWQNDWVTRLFDRRKAKYGPKPVHETLQVNGPVGKLKHSMVHYTYKCLTSYLQKHNEYSTAAAQEMAKKGTEITAYHLLIKPSFRFFRFYVLNMGFLDGKEGIAIAWINSYTVFQRHLKAWRLQHKEKIRSTDSSPK